MPVVEVYGKHDRCLCDQVKATLARVRREIAFELVEVEIESSPELDERLKERIPLVVIDGRLALKCRVDERALRRRLVRGSPSGPSLRSRSRRLTRGSQNETLRSYSTRSCA